MSDGEGIGALSNAINELLRWQKLVYGQDVRERLLNILDEDRKRLAYEATDGASTTRQIAEIAGVSPQTISNWWSEWLAEGILEQGQDRPMKLASLQELGIL